VPRRHTAWLVWGVGVTAYFVAVVYRTSLGVAWLDATARFGIGASALSTCMITQVMLYAVLQIPAGLLVDRYGPRRVLCAGILLLCAGQLCFAFATTFPAALAARAVLGTGDAMAFVSVLRLGASWFPGRRNPLIVQLTAQIGMAGSLVCTEVLSWMLFRAGWTPTFAVSALAGLGMLGVVLLFVRDNPEPVVRPGRAARLPVPAQLRAAWAEPGTRMGMWVHFTCQFPGMSFLLLWGLPFLVLGQGLSRPAASGLLSLEVIGNMAFGLLFGQLVSQRQGIRTPLVLTVILGTGASWVVVLSWPGGRVPMALLVVFVFLLGSNAAACLVGLEYARPVNPPERTGTALGIVNMGGFSATALTTLGIGVVLDWWTPDGAGYSLPAFRAAFCVLFVPMFLGLRQILRLRRLAARREAEIRGAP
jgi:MFS family permease